MEAILLAGGFGTRIRPLTYTRPKPLLPVLNRTLVERILDKMPKAVDKVVLPVNYLGVMIKAHFEERPDPRLVIVDEPEPLGTGGAIKAVEKHFTGPFIVYNGDIVASIDLDKFHQNHVKNRAKASVSLFPVAEPWHFGVVELNGTGRIRTFVEKPPQGQEPSNLVNAGHYLLDPSLLDRIPKKKFVSLEKEVFTPFAKEGGALFGYRFDGHWIDCGRPESFLEAHRVLLVEAKKKSVLGEDVMVEKGATFASYAAGDGCRFKSGARVERSVLLPGVKVGKDAIILDSILGEGVEVGADARLERCVVGDFAEVGAGTKIMDQKIGMRPGDENQ